MTKEDFNPDYSLNIPYLIKEFQEACIVIRNDNDTLKTPGIISWKVHQRWIGTLLLATGHTINWQTGKVEYTRKK